jgi:pimeloyl-ACP methyl ester carboxylesterase
MPYAHSANAKIYYEVMGDPASPPMLFIGGFSAQIVGWQEDFCRLFVQRGFQVIRFDNRDVGLSQQFDGTEGHEPGYTLHDMAQDGFAILDALGIARAHVVGQSMGGMIAQCMANARPERVISLTLVYTAPLVNVQFLPPLAEVGTMNFGRRERAEFIDDIVDQQRANASSIYPFEEDWVRQFAQTSYDRAHTPEGVVRQLHAMLADLGTPFADPARLTMPVVLIHGLDDVNVHVSGSLELARCLPHAEVHLYPGMKHAVVKPLWKEFCDIIVRTARRADRELAEAMAALDSLAVAPPA